MNQITKELKTAEELTQILQNGSSGVFDAIWAWLFCEPPKPSSITAAELEDLSELQKMWCATAQSAQELGTDGFFVENLYHPKPTLTKAKVTSPFSITTFEEICDELLSFQENILWSTEQHTKIKERARKIPGFFRFSSWILETRLNDESHVDLAFNLGPLFRNETPISRAFTPDDLQEQKRWQKKYTTQRQPDQALVPGWIEIDATDFSYEGPEENLFLNIHPRTEPNDILEYLQSTYSTHDWNNVWPPIAHFIANLPPQADFMQLGIMQRRNHVLKTVAFNFKSNEITGFLDAISWQGNKVLLQNVSLTLAQYPEFSFALSVDFEGSVQPTIGIEVHFFPMDSKDQFNQPRLFQELVQKRFARLLHFLQAPIFANIVNKNKLESLSRYPRIQIGQPFFLYASTISHLKITVGDTLNVKAYIYQDLRI